MDQGVAHQSQAKVPLLAAQVMQQSLVDEAAIRKARDHAARRQDGAGLL